METSTTLTPGTILNNTYKIIKVLGQGGFGITYLAMDVNLNRRVAIKEFFPQDYCKRGEGASTVLPLSTNQQTFAEDLRKKFVKEARNIALMNHRGIVSIMSAFDQNGTSYYVMEIIDGESFDSIISKYGPLTLDRAIGYMETIGEALEYIHSKQINHLDIKPSNIMVRTEDNTPILIDFGLSKHYDQSGRATTVSPTGMSHGYAPYEQYLDRGLEEFSPATDVYSLAATLYYLLSGVVPPHAMTLIEGDLPFPVNMPDAVKPVLTKAMSVQRTKRHQSVREFIDELRAIRAAAPAAPASADHGKTVVVDHSSSFQPVSQQPVSQQPISQQPVSQQPMSQQPISEPYSDDYSDTSSEEGGKSKRNKIIAIVAVVAVVIAGAVLAIVFGSGNGSGPETSTASQESAAAAGRAIVTDMQFTNSKGNTYTYSGPVDSDGVPDGIGKCANESGIYEGRFINGLREGDARCEMKDGSIFEGKYSNDECVSGRITWKDGGYYEGTFKDDKVYNGGVYSKDGTLETKVVNGKY